MRPRLLRRRLALAALGAIVAGVVLGTGIARADSTSDLYTARHGSAVCVVLDKFPTDEGVSGVMHGIQEDGLTNDQAAAVVVDSVALFCPRNQPVIDGFVRRWAPPADTPTPGIGGLSVA